MIGRLAGNVIAQEDDGTVVLDVGGVGYELTVPLGTLGRARSDDAGRTVFFVHTHVREDALTLFAFADDRDRGAFRTLIGVSNVGPKTAIAVLSALPAEELARAVAGRELGKLTAISGVGKKTAERLLLELKDKLPVLTHAGAGNVQVAAKPAVANGAGGKAELLASALTRLGYKPQEADRAVKALEAEIEGADLAHLVREALAVLAK
jgi:Holliday junction DNA helicase RuvA